MFQGLKVLAVVPARGGSKGIPLKNIYPLKNRALITYTLDLLKSISWIDHSCVSTDNLKIEQVVKDNSDFKVVKRPADLSGDFVGDLPVLKHALEVAETDNSTKFDVILMLQPTSPIRNTSQIERCIEHLIQAELEAVWTVSRADLKYHPLKQIKIDSTGLVVPFLEESNRIMARQQLSASFYKNGICYAFTRNAVQTSSSVLIKGRTGAVEILDPFVNIDSLDDLHAAEFLIKD